jgi:hypothetical protein
MRKKSLSTILKNFPIKYNTNKEEVLKKYNEFYQEVLYERATKGDIEEIYTDEEIIYKATEKVEKYYNSIK